MKFTKAAALLMSVSIVGISVAACGSEPEPVSSDVNIISTQQQGGNGATVHQADPQAESENFVLNYRGCNFIVNTAFDESKLPDDNYETLEVASCAGQGMAKMYRFGSSVWVELFTDSDVIAAIYVKDDTVTTAEGVYIGQTLDDVKAVYGEPQTQTEALAIYVKGTSKLHFGFNGEGKITSIEYFAPQD